MGAGEGVVTITEQEDGYCWEITNPFWSRSGVEVSFRAALAAAVQVLVAAGWIDAAIGVLDAHR